ncbi:hypothetical protein [Sulfitobacter sp. S190]|uniref:hypothetical protein n=1 Tax=Sulfitobacter sp. S190 TaxID=2867022 RepID=UPI0021A4DCEC|nr:hypothetical protein [Sulfitobacter sp. S190]UWR23293.1 hypothetical protein K3756_04690 [Sulfitobacter sp. S190]
MDSPATLLGNLNRGLLYWEDLTAPLFANPNIFKSEYSDKVLKLHRDGILDIPQFHFTMNTRTVSFGNDSMRMLGIYQAKRETANENWALLPSNSHDAIPSTTEFVSKLQGSPQSVLHVGLFRQLPIPSETVNPMKIVEFRNANTSALRSLHYAINELSSKYCSLADEEEPLLRAQAELDDALEGYIEPARQRVAKGGLMTLELSLLLGSAGIGGVLAGPTGAMLSSLAGYGGVKLISNLQAKIPRATTASPFAYALQASKL